MSPYDVSIIFPCRCEAGEAGRGNPIQCVILSEAKDLMDLRDLRMISLERLGTTFRVGLRRRSALAGRLAMTLGLTTNCFYQQSSILGILRIFVFVQISYSSVFIDENSLNTAPSSPAWNQCKLSGGSVN